MSHTCRTLHFTGFITATVNYSFFISRNYCYFDERMAETMLLQKYISKIGAVKQSAITTTWSYPWRAIDWCALIAIVLDEYQ